MHTTRSITNIFAMIIAFAFVLFGVLETLDITAVVRNNEFLNTYRIMDYSSLAIIIGGVLFNSLISFHLSDVFKALRNTFAVFSPVESAHKQKAQILETILQWDERFKLNKNEAIQYLLEHTQNDLHITFLSLMSTNYSVETFRQMAEKKIESKYLHKIDEAEVLTTMGNSAPAFGMLGNIFGMILMLTKFDDAARLATGLSTAIMTTLYGLVFAYFAFLPTAKKVKQNALSAYHADKMMVEGAVMIMENKSTFYINDRLDSFLHS